MAKRKPNKIKVLMASPEVEPIARSGGLGDVAGALPKALNKLNCDARLIMPKYGTIGEEKKYDAKKILSFVKFKIGKEEVEINVWMTKKAIRGVTVYMTENSKYFGRNRLYYGNVPRRFMFFSAACLEVLPLLGFKPDVIHCHDFHTGLIPALLKTGRYPYLENIKILYTIHNLRYQGKAVPRTLSVADITKSSLYSLTKDAEDGDVNCMVQAIINADLINTVSPAYAKEIATKEYGAGLEKIIKKNKHKLHGILNGLDLKLHDPLHDKNIRHKYSSKNISNKVKNKLHLQKKLGLPIDKNIPMVGFIARLVYQKGIELFTEKMIDNLPCQFVFLGSGYERYENHLRHLAKKFPDKVSTNIMFDFKLAQQIYAGCDIFTIPSRFEPCGLTQMISMRYGTIVVARDTGGLKDTVDQKVGFKFSDFSSKDFESALKKAIKVYNDDPKKWLKLQKNSFKRDFSWNKSAKDYLAIYKKLISGATGQKAKRS
ncbi:glycosyltransferase [Candidatus Falkowbacteria bacterium]|nr:glycosyltransferase [Candidatus Falkowbacteria bacterium]